MRPWSCLVLVLAACGEAAAPAEPVSVAEAAPEVEEEAPIEAPEGAVAGEADEVAEVLPSAHELLVLTVGEPALLPSETRLAEFLEARMRRNRRDAELRPATAEEAAFFAGEGGLPATFGEARRVLVLHFPEPRTLPNGDLRSRGIDRVVLYQLPGVEPAFVAGMDEAWRLEDEQWATWIAGLLREGDGA